MTKLSLLLSLLAFTGICAGAEPPSILFESHRSTPSADPSRDGFLRALSPTVSLSVTDEALLITNGPKIWVAHIARSTPHADCLTDVLARGAEGSTEFYVTYLRLNPEARCASLNVEKVERLVVGSFERLADGRASDLTLTSFYRGQVPEPITRGWAERMLNLLASFGMLFSR